MYDCMCSAWTQPYLLERQHLQGEIQGAAEHGPVGGRRHIRGHRHTGGQGGCGEGAALRLPAGGHPRGSHGRAASGGPSKAHAQAESHPCLIVEEQGQIGG